MSFAVTLFQSVKPCDDVGPTISGVLQNLRNCNISLDHVDTYEDVLRECLEQCEITSLYLPHFGLYDQKTESWLNLARTVPKANGCNVSSEIQLRIRFIFNNMLPQQKGRQHAYRHSVPDNTKHTVINENVVSYLCNQKRDDFQKGLLKISIDTLDEHSANLGIAVMDMICLASALGWELPRVKQHVSLKKLVSHAYAQQLQSKHLVKRKIIKIRFHKYLEHLVVKYRRFVSSGLGLNYFQVKYLENLDTVVGFDNAETYALLPDVADQNRFTKVSVAYDGNVSCASGNEAERVWCNVAEISDIRICENNNDQNEAIWSVTITKLNGEFLCLSLASEIKAENLASCVNGCYQLLVDAHHFLCKKVTRPSLIKQLELSCHGPISASYAEHLLWQLPLPHLGDCVLRCSPEKYHEYFINTFLPNNHSGQLEVKNFRLDFIDGKIGIYGSDNQHVHDTLEDFLKQGMNEFFNIAKLLHPTRNQQSTLLVHLGAKNMEPLDKGKTSQIQIINQGDYKWQKLLGSGRFTEVTLYAHRSQLNTRVVVKRCYEDHVGRKQHIETSFQDSMLKFSCLESLHLIQQKGTMSNMLVVEYVPYGSITKYAVENPAMPSRDWFTAVFWQLAHACTYLEEKNCAHGNIKGVNILLKLVSYPPFIKLADPGITTSKEKHDFDLVVEPTLTAPWVAYEYCRVLTNPTCTSPTINGDKWSFATCVCEIGHWHQAKDACCNVNAYSFNNALKEKYDNGTVIPIPNILQDTKMKGFLDLLKKCWRKWPRGRPAFQQILCELSTLLHSDFHFDESNVVEPDEEPQSEYQVFDDEDLMQYQQLGKGHFGYVDLCLYLPKGSRGDERGDLVAVKSLIRTCNTQQSRNDMFNEIQTMKQINHPHVVKLKGITAPTVRIVMEYLACGSLASYIHKRNKDNFPLSDLFPSFYRFSSQIADGMLALRRHRLIHRDLALRNILLDRVTKNGPLYVKISDFGLSRVLNEDRDYYRGTSGSMPYRWHAPECLEGNSFQFESDIWSFGVTVWEMFSYGACPKYGISDGDVPGLYKLIKDGHRLVKPQECPQLVYEDLICKCWEYNPQNRMSFEELRTKFLRLCLTYEQRPK